MSVQDREVPATVVTGEIVCERREPGLDIGIVETREDNVDGKRDVLADFCGMGFIDKMEEDAPAGVLIRIPERFAGLLHDRVNPGDDMGFRRG